MLVRSTGSIHLMSTWDEGIPEDIPRQNLFGLTWNPMKTIEVLGRVEGTAGARRVGTDAMSPTFAQLLPGRLSRRRARRRRGRDAGGAQIKTEEELAVLREAVAVAETRRHGHGGRPAAARGDREGAGRSAARGGRRGRGDHPRRPGRGRRHQPGTPLAAGGGDGRAGAGDLVAFTAGVVAHGYIAEVGRTYAAGGGIPEALAARRGTGVERLLAACRPGAPASDLLAAYAGAGEPLPPMPVARGLGLGFDPPVVTGALPGPGGTTSALRRAWCSPSPATCGNRAPERPSVATPCSSPATAPSC